MREHESRDGAGHRDRAIAVGRHAFDHVALRIEIHLSLRRERRALAIVDHVDGPVGFPNEHESAAAGAQQFAAESSFGQGKFVNPIHFPIGNFDAQAALGLPGFVKQGAESRNVPPASQNRYAFVNQIFHDSQLALLPVEIRDVAFGNIGSCPLDAGIKKHQV